MRKNRFLLSITATALITAVLLSSCTAGRANSDASLQNSSASSAAGSLNSSLRTVASVPSGEISDKDEFLKGIWVDENGFVASFSENGRTAVFDEQTRKSVKITAQDKDTISFPISVPFTGISLFTESGYGKDSTKKINRNTTGITNALPNASQN